MQNLLSKSHRILEKGLMEFHPFGHDSNGKMIRDVSGLTISANVQFMVELISQNESPYVGTQSVHTLTQLLNERIPDPSFHISPEFLQNPWNSYSYEFAMFLSEFCVDLTKDTNFHANLGKGTFFSPIIHTLVKPFSLKQIYRLFPYFVEKFTKGSLVPEVISLSGNSAIIRLSLSSQTQKQFGAYQLGCADRICQTTKATLAETPAKMFGLPPALINDHSCMGDGAKFCEWELSWQSPEPDLGTNPLLSFGAGFAFFLVLSSFFPLLAFPEKMGLACLPILGIWIAQHHWRNKRKIQNQRQLIEEQLHAVEAQHEELREAYLSQEHTVVELRQRLKELTTLNQIGIRLSTSLDRETVIHTGLESMIRALPYNRAMISFFDQQHSVAHQAKVLGVSEDLAAQAHAIRIPITDPESIEGTVLLKGLPVLVTDVHAIWNRLHPLNQQLISAFHTQAFIAIPLKAKNTILGAMVVDRTNPYPLTENDMNLLMTVGSQIALALDNAEAYTEIEHLNVGLETKVRERTYELEQLNGHLCTANEQLQELDRVKSQFLSHCSHELRTPLTSIKGFTENLLRGFCGSLNEKQHLYLGRVNANADRLTRMIADLLDLSRIETGKIHLRLTEISIHQLITDILGQLTPLADGKHQRLVYDYPDQHIHLIGDSDRLTQVLTNIIHNAIKFTPDKGIIEVSVGLDSPENLGITISDSGPGIPNDIIPRLFDPFFQGHRQPEIGCKGLGLGLSIVQNLVDLHGGTIQVQKKVEQGACFHISLPLTPLPNLSSARG
jgi:signal transduction histidine kinase